MSLKPYDEMVRLYPGGFNVALEGGENHRWPIDKAKYKQLLGTGKAYLSAYTHEYKVSDRELDGRSTRKDYTWFNVQPPPERRSIAHRYAVYRAPKVPRGPSGALFVERIASAGDYFFPKSWCS
jgi:hypothetical protein